MFLKLIPLIEQIFKFVCLLLEGMPVEVRKANATIWFFMWWPLNKRILEHAGLSKEDLDMIEANVKGGDK